MKKILGRFVICALISALSAGCGERARENAEWAFAYGGAALLAVAAYPLLKVAHVIGDASSSAKRKAYRKAAEMEIKKGLAACPPGFETACKDFYSYGYHDPDLSDLATRQMPNKALAPQGRDKDSYEALLARLKEQGPPEDPGQCAVVIGIAVEYARYRAPVTELAEDLKPLMAPTAGPSRNLVGAMMFQSGVMTAFGSTMEKYSEALSSLNCSSKKDVAKRQEAAWALGLLVPIYERDFNTRAGSAYLSSGMASLYAAAAYVSEGGAQKRWTEKAAAMYSAIARGHPNDVERLNALYSFCRLPVADTRKLELVCAVHDIRFKNAALTGGVTFSPLPPPLWSPMWDPDSDDVYAEPERQGWAVAHGIGRGIPDKAIRERAEACLLPLGTRPAIGDQNIARRGKKS